MNISNIVFNISNFTKITIPREEQIVTVHQIGIGEVIAYFVIYFVIHIIIGIQKEKYEKLVNPTEDDFKTKKILIHLFKWWPGIFLLLILLTQFGNF